MQAWFTFVITIYIAKWLLIYSIAYWSIIYDYKLKATKDLKGDFFNQESNSSPKMESTGNIGCIISAC